MAWREQYQIGSFRGVTFRTESHNASGGRRGQTHEYPQRDTPYFEDLGRRAKTYDIECFVSGPDYMAARDALIAALDAYGSGILVHPYHGQIEVNAPQYSYTESTSEGGIARFSISFVEAGRLQAGETKTDTAVVANEAADAADTAALASFATRFSMDGMPSYIDDAMADLLKVFGISASQASGLLSGAGKALNAYQAGIALLDSAITLVRTPILLAQTVSGIVHAVGAMAITPLARLNALLSIFRSPSRFGAILGDTPVRRQQITNTNAFANLVRQTAAAGAVRAVSEIRFSSYEEAAALRSAFAAELDAAATAAADAGDDDHAEALDILRRIMVRDVTTRGASLARLFVYTPQLTEPALVIANRIYGADDVESRSIDLLNRNRIQHPGFVPGGRPLELLTPPARGGEA
jgi:prophage DNA circulation protein